MKPKYPGGMTFTQWRRTPYRIKHRLVGVAINGRFGYWRSCPDPRCRRARQCQDYDCYWRRLDEMAVDDRSRVRKAAEPLAKLVWIGSSKGAERLPLF
jgi:hypothetical protein